MLTVQRVDRRGRRIRHDLDQKWLLKVMTDPATKLLVVCDAKVLPMWCRACAKEICAVGYKCKTCTNFTICIDCCLNGSVKSSHQTHGWECVRDDLVGEDDE